MQLTFRVILAVSESVGPSRGPPQVPSQLVRVSDPSQPVEMVALVGVLLPPGRISLLAVRCARLPQGGRATRPLLGAGYGAGAGGTLPHSGVGRLAVWVRLPQSAARSASLSTRAASPLQSRQR